MQTLDMLNSEEILEYINILFVYYACGEIYMKMSCIKIKKNSIILLKKINIIYLIGEFKLFIMIAEYLVNLNYSKL